MDDRFASAVSTRSAQIGTARLTDQSDTPKWRSWDDPGVPLGRAHRSERGLAFSVSPGEWIILGADPIDANAVDLTHVRAMFRITGGGARRILEHVCALDLGDEMTPNGAAARAPVAGVATEIIRDDEGRETSFILLMSRSFARHVWDRLGEVAEGI